MTLVKAEEFSNLDGSLGQTNFIFNEQGTSWGAVNKYQEVLFCWIDTLLGIDTVVGRIDAQGFNDDTKVSPLSLSTNPGVQGVRCCYNPLTDGWIVVYNVGTTIYYAKFTRLLVLVGLEIAFPTALPSSDPSAYNAGCDDFGNLYISWPGHIIKVNANTDVVVVNKNIDAGNRMHVHVRSSFVDLTRLTSSNIVVDRYDGSLNYRYTIVVVSSPSLNSKMHEITSRYGHEGFIVVYVDGAVGDNIHYRGFSSSGLPLYATRTIAGTGNIDITANKGRLSVQIGELARLDDQWHTFAVRAASTNLASNRVISLIEPQNFNPQIIDKEEVVLVADNEARFGQAIALPSQFEIRSLKPMVSGSPPVIMAMEVYVRQSVWMSLWRQETNARVYGSSLLDSDARVLVENFYTSAYPGGNRLAGSAGTRDSDYVASPGRTAVDPDTTSFSSYWGTATTEDNVFIGGPMSSEIAKSFEENPANFDPQILALQAENGVSAFEFFTLGKGNGFAFAPISAELRATILGIPRVLQRHPIDPSRWAQAGQAVDYAIIIRLPLSVNSTQSERAMIYAAGINLIGTKAAAYVLTNPLQYKLGSSCLHLVVAEYDENITTSAGYIPGSTGKINVSPLKNVNIDNYEGIR